ncbi:soluble lytic murein transglycosylase precursor [bacterium BMS3Abin07]|nr:soluble lytic murein transglycosylase precursor [bacterium BMS3Abin07]GBE33074.1 soluble lytic murein transglycosylase precursor [bacterium BMS3Bbin05]
MSKLIHRAGFLIIMLGLLSSTPAMCMQTADANDTGIKTLQEGIKLMHEDTYGRAITKFSSVISDDFIINDFALLWRAESYYRTGNIDKAMADIKEIKDDYGDTSAFRDALRLEIEISRRNIDDTSEILALYRNYLSLYPADLEIQYRYAKSLKSAGADDKAAEIFKNLYIKASDFSDESYKEFDPAILNSEDLFRRGNSLIRQMKFTNAETAFRRALDMAREDMKDEIYEKIAYCRFRRKDYPEAAELYKKLNDRYMEAVSYLRTSEMDKLIKTIDILKEMKDPRTGLLLISLANNERRKGNYNNAVSILNNELDKYPFREESLWQKGWTGYLEGNYKDAENIFNKLYNSYNSNKYLYWALRSREKMSQDVTGGYGKLCSENDYYGFLSCLKTGTGSKKIPVSTDNIKIDSPLLKRFGILKKLGLRKEAIFELKKMIKTLKKPAEVILYSKKLKEIGEFKKAISVATMLPYDEKIHTLLYPAAYWDIVEEASRKFRIDPVYILSIAREESRFDPEAHSIAGAVGLMQLMPETADRMCRKIKCNIPEEDSYLNIRTNIILGSYYLKTLLDQFKSVTLATAAYNAGENTVKKWLAQFNTREADEFIEDIPYSETRQYVKRVLTTFFQYSRSLNLPDAPGTFRWNVSLHLD